MTVRILTFCGAESVGAARGKVRTVRGPLAGSSGERVGRPLRPRRHLPTLPHRCRRPRRRADHGITPRLVRVPHLQEQQREPRSLPDVPRPTPADHTQLDQHPLSRGRRLADELLLSGAAAQEIDMQPMCFSVDIQCR